jgi:hypothetical protein
MELKYCVVYEEINDFEYGSPWENQIYESNSQEEARNVYNEKKNDTKCRNVKLCTIIDEFNTEPEVYPEVEKHIYTEEERIARNKIHDLIHKWFCTYNPLKNILNLN